MPDDSTNTTPPTTPPPAVADDSAVPEAQPTEPATSNPTQLSAMLEVMDKIAECQNILVALSSDPSVDELAAAIGLSIYLDKLGKHVTAIYSGVTPNALEFLKPEETFEQTVDSLQDFVIALSKEKADHLRYKLDGDFVKIYITPYRTKLGADDLDFSYGDFNVDLVLAFNVMNGIDLDDALREHGRIMHDASIVNITNGNPGKFGEIEWGDKSASSVSEMISNLIFENNSDEIGEAVATALLTGIVAATNRFSNAKTTPATMQIASQLMERGANQQLISKNISPDVERTLHRHSKNANSSDEAEDVAEEDSTLLDITHEETEDAEAAPEEVNETETAQEPEAISEPEKTEFEPLAPETTEPVEPTRPEEPGSDLLDDLKAAEASLSQAGAETTPDTDNQPVEIEDGELKQAPALENVPNQVPNFEPLQPAIPPEEKTVEPPVDFSATPADDETNRYGKMLEEALASAGVETPAAPEAPIAPEAPVEGNPAAASAPTVPDAPEINGVPEINYATPSDANILPPPPAPPVNTEPISPAMPLPTPVMEPLGPQPAMQDQVYVPQAADPSAFKIPGAQ